MEASIESQKKDFLWKMWNDGIAYDNTIIDFERAKSLIPISFTPHEKGYTMISNIGNVLLSIAEISRYGVVEDALYSYSIRQLLKCIYKIEFETPFPTERIKWGKVELYLKAGLLQEQIKRIEEIRTPLIFVNGREKIGKTTVVNAYCSQFYSRHGDIAYFLDFNRGHFDFCDFVNEFSALPMDRTKKYAIFLDNLYCCDVETAEKILDFFCDLVEALKKTKISLKVIVAETPETVFRKSARDNTILLELPTRLPNGRKVVLPYDTDILIVQCALAPLNLVKDPIELGEKLFKKVARNDRLSPNEIRLFYKILTLSTAGFYIILDNGEKSILLEEGGLFSKIYGLTVYKNVFSQNSCIVSFFKFDTAKFILDYMEYEFSKQLERYDKKEICTQYLLEHYDIGSLIHLLKMKPNVFYSDTINDTFLQDYLYLTEYCIDRKREIVAEINSSPQDKILGNHLGRILFALETIVGVKERSWEDQRAIIKIKTLVRNMYFISKEVALPNTNYQYIEKEKTVEDFFTDKDKDSIRAQVELQDILMENYHFQEDCAIMAPEDTEQFAYYLTELQKKHRHINDYGKFFQTYLLALLLEFESTMIDIDPELDRLDLLLDRVFQTAQYSKTPSDDSEADDNYCYFYPARVPWVTGRMYLAISAYLRRKDHEKANKLKIKMERWLKAVSHQFTLDGEECCIWCAGTGSWNTVLDTTILCMSAMEFREPRIFSAAKNYISAREPDWLLPNNLTSGISALEILSDAVEPVSIHNLKGKIENLVKSYQKAPEESKSDGAMGDSHIAQKLVDLCTKHRKYAIDALSERLYHRKETKQMKKDTIYFKVGVTFSGKYRDNYVEPFCNELLKLGFKREEIFYDKWHEALINGPHGDTTLRGIYSSCCDCVVVLLSPDYKEKNWTGHIEWPSVLELINIGRDEKICLLSIDGIETGDIPGLYSNQAIAKPIDDISAMETAAFIQQKYEMAIKPKINYL